MKLQSTFVPQNKVHKKLHEGIDNFDSIFSKINLLLHENLYPIKKTSYHFIGQMLKKLVPGDRTTRAFASNLFKACYQSEILSAGGANIAYLFGVTLAKEIIKSSLGEIPTQKLLEEFDFFIEILKKNIERESQICSSEDIKQMITEVCEHEQVLSAAIWESLELAGLEGKIFIENGKQNNFIIELKEGYTFNLTPFTFMLKNKIWDRKNCKVFIVDGLVEKVSEIDHILNKSFETKIPMAIIAHGFSEEVVATLKINQEKNILDVQPIRIPPDVDSLNVVNDISVVCGCLPISAMKGDLIALTKYESLPLVERIKLSNFECSFENSKTRAAVSQQIQTIVEKRQRYFLHEEVQELFDKRLRSLVSSAVLLYLPDVSPMENDTMRVKIDICLRQTKSILQSGTIELTNKVINDNINKSNDINELFLRTFNNFSERLQSEKIYKVPAISAISGIMLAGKAILLLMTSSGFVKFT